MGRKSANLFGNDASPPITSLSDAANSAGIGVAVPVDTINAVVPDLIRHGRVLRPGLGVTLHEYWIPRRLGLRGVLTDGVLEGTGADEVGLHGTTIDQRGYICELGDVILKVVGRNVQTINGLKDALEHKKAGDTLQLTVLRDETVLVATVKLQMLK